MPTPSNPSLSEVQRGVGVPVGLDGPVGNIAASTQGENELNAKVFLLDLQKLICVRRLVAWFSEVYISMKTKQKAG